MSLLAMLYALAVIVLTLYGFNAIIYTLIFIHANWIAPRRAHTPPAPAEWPTVTVQLPIFNERYVVERLIDSIVALDYPADRLHIQVLDDSTDDTAALARAKVAHHCARGVNIEYIQRPHRVGFKAGALAYGLTRTASDFIAVFDADFTPPADFLKRIIPHFNDARVGMAQARWGHINADYSLLTRAQAMMLDGHFGIEQHARAQTGLFLNFNGSAGVWRRACIEDAGGWEADTLAEDLDLSYRAQLKGWRLRYLPDLVVPAEIPTLLGAFKRQQFRWAKGSIQCVRKHAAQIILSRESAWRKLQALLHITAYIVHPLMTLVVLMSLPLALTGEISRIHLGAIGLAGFGAPIMFAVSQFALYPDWHQRLSFLPTILFLGPGIAVSNTWAVIEALIGRNPTLFLRTPKFDAQGKAKTDRPSGTAAYGLPVDWTTWAEIALMFYSAITTVIALQCAPGLAPFTASYAIGFGYTAYLGLRQSLGIRIEPAESIRGAITTE
ncbi:MAG: glycosyltransferase [Chloroflexi bacterium]|nr:glycosyltransferase [Chloroflexota bacterium]